MPTKRGITIFLVPHNRKKSLSIKLSGWQVIACSAGLGVALILLILGVVLWGSSIKTIAANRALKAENEGLRQQIVKIVKLERELAETSKLRAWMEQLIGAGETPERGDVRRASISGGDFSAIIDGPFKMKLVPEFESAAMERMRRLDFIPKGLPVDGAITARFGEIGGKFLGPHTGVDIAAPMNAIIRATASGIVSEEINDQSLGIGLEIDHLNGYKTRYGHMSTVSRNTGDWIERGDRIGNVGESGHAEGPHVHYEVRVGGVLVDPLETYTGVSYKKEG